MHAIRFALGLAFGLFFTTALAWAIIIDTGTGKVAGFVISDDGTNLKISIRTPDGGEYEKSFERGKIRILHEINVNRLENLSPDKPWRYFQYAEELARHKDDPEARARAKELYLIAANIKKEEFGVKSLRGMSALADTEAEARKYLAAAFLLDPKADDKMLKAGKLAQAAQISARDLDEFINTLHLYRARKFKEAEKTAQGGGMGKIFSTAHPSNLDLKGFLDLCAKAYCHTCAENGTVKCPNCRDGNVYLSNGAFDRRCNECKKGRKRCPVCGGKHFNAPDDRAARVVLQCEVWALNRQQGWRNDPARNQAAGANSWSAVVQSGRMPPVGLSLDMMIKGFDPNKNLYRNRKWVGKSAP